jgi:hypothetical protein
MSKAQIHGHNAGLVFTVAAAALGSVGCSPVSPTPPGTGAVVENQEANPVEIQVLDDSGQFTAFLIPANAWVALPGAHWTTVHRVGDDCTTVSARGFYPGSRPYAIFILANGALDEYDPGFPVPTLGPLASATGSTRCPNGPPQPSASIG